MEERDDGRAEEQDDGQVRRPGVPFGRVRRQGSTNRMTAGFDEQDDGSVEELGSTNRMTAWCDGWVWPVAPFGRVRRLGATAGG